jgi:hypothetical protein
MVERRSYVTRFRYSGRFFGRRVNCEQVPLLPARVVAWVLDDSRKIPYLLVWKSRSDGTVQETVSIAPHNEIERQGGLDCAGAVEIKRHKSIGNFIRTLFCPLPQNGGKSGFSFVRTVRLRAEGCMDGSQADSSLLALCDQRGGAGNAMVCAMRQKVERSYIADTVLPFGCLRPLVVLAAQSARSRGIPTCSPRLKKRQEWVALDKSDRRTSRLTEIPLLR